MEAFFPCFASMRNIEIWSETKIKRSKNETKKAKTAVIFTSEQTEAKQKQNFFRFDVKKVFENEMKQKSKIFKAKKDKVILRDNL